MGGIEMVDLRKLFPFFRVKICDPCIEKSKEIQETQRRARARIDQMSRTIDQASMDGEERWFLSLTKTKGGCDHG
jgi:hypothetical protein